eukprot:scaffold9688_cov60-Attheya_sp.AAC.3
MDSSVPTPPPNGTPLCARPSSDDTRKHKAIATPTRPTPPHNTRLTSPPTVVTGGTNCVPVIRNPYKRSSTPQPIPRSTVAVTPSSSAKKTSHSSSAPPLSRKKKVAPRCFKNDAANDDAANNDALNNDAANDNAANDDAANNEAENDSNKADNTAAMISDHNSFDTKAYSLMRTQFIRTRVSHKQKQAIDNDGRVLRSFCDMDISEDVDAEAESVLTSDTRRLSHYLLEAFTVLPEKTPLVLLIPIKNSTFSGKAKSAVTSQPGAGIICMGSLFYFKMMATIFFATLGMELFGGLMSEAQLLLAFNRRDGVSIDVTGVWMVCDSN